MTARALRQVRALALPATDLTALRERVSRLAEPRPAVYRMLDPLGRVIYVGKAKRLRQRLLSYFRASYPEDKSARILYAAQDIQWDYVPSEFAACLGELRQIQRHRPILNWQMNRTRRTVFVRVSGGPASRITSGPGTGSKEGQCYGPFVSAARVAEGVRTLNDLLGLRDCAATMPMVFAGQQDLFDAPLKAACMRHELGTCSAPCAGFVSQSGYAARVDAALAFLEGRAITPIDRAMSSMQGASDADEFERAARWREKLDQLIWLLSATARARAAVAALTFVYRDPGTFGDDRAYLIRHGVVRSAYPFPTTPLELEAYQGVVRQELEQPDPAPGPLPFQQLDEILLVMAWFRRHPDAFRRTTPLSRWVA